MKNDVDVNSKNFQVGYIVANSNECISAYGTQFSIEKRDKKRNMLEKENDCIQFATFTLLRRHHPRHPHP